jgi:hypothetical protein
MILVLAMGCGLGWIAHIVHDAQIQCDTVAAIQKAGGSVSYDWERLADQNNGRVDLPTWDVRLMDRLGVDYTHTAVEVWYDRKVSDRDLEIVARLPRLETLGYFGSSITDAGLVHVRRLTRLTKLDLGYSEVTDDGLVHLAGLNSLHDLDLSGTGITDAGLARIEGLTGLRTLSLLNTGVTERGVVHLKKLTNLRLLDLRRTKVDDFGAQDYRRALPQAKVKFSPAIYAR